MPHQEDKVYPTHTISVTRLQLCPLLQELLLQRLLLLYVVHSTYQLLSKPKTHN